MIERYIKHMLKAQHDIDVKSLKINSTHEFISDSTSDIVFYVIDFSFIDTIEHNHCKITLRCDYHDYETNTELYIDYIQLTITYK